MLFVKFHVLNCFVRFCTNKLSRLIRVDGTAEFQVDRRGRVLVGGGVMFA